MWYAVVRDKVGGPPTTLKGRFNDNDMYMDCEFRYSSLEEDTPEGYNIVIWLEDTDFVDLAQSIDFDFFLG